MNAIVAGKYVEIAPICNVQSVEYQECLKYLFPLKETVFSILSSALSISPKIVFSMLIKANVTWNENENMKIVGKKISWPFPSSKKSENTPSVDSIRAAVLKALIKGLEYYLNDI